MNNHPNLATFETTQTPAPRWRRRPAWTLAPLAWMALAGGALVHCKNEPPAPGGSSAQATGSAASVSAASPAAKGAAKHKGTPEDPFVVGMSQCNLGEPWRVQMNDDVRKAAEKHPNLKIVFKDAQNDSLVQRGQLEEFVNQGVDAILISPKEAAPLTEPVAKAFRTGIPVIVLDRALLKEDYTTFIGADNVKIGREAGKWVAETLGGKGTVVELKGLMTSVPGQDRHRGFIEGLDTKAHPGIKVVFEADMQWLEPNARKEMESALATQPKIDVVYAHNDPGAHGAYLAAKQVGREKSMKFVGIDALPHEGVQYVKDGILSVTFQYPTGGAEAVATTLKALAGENVPKKIVLPTRVFTRDNVAAGGQEIP
ncbi:substrate-binding domain-containing protein [Pendulispora albinea]|uniref:Substrate-binding domain-containing protein n=1 Tax=Pendulispora albinea TaxID=2741071 RepID=A0ABZ2M8Z5_9BACT